MRSQILNMPARNNSEYKRPFALINGHFETIYPAFFRTIEGIQKPRRERISTPDNDFLDIDWFENQSDKVVIVQHGLEGSSDRPYVVGMAKCFFDAGYDILTWNFRGCSGEINLAKRLYHSGTTDDLHTVINLASEKYQEIYLVGFSLGGNLTLKYLGEQKPNPKIKKGVAISAPLDLHLGVLELHSAKGWIYEKRFVKNLKAKARLKVAQHPGLINLDILSKIKTLYDFDDQVTAPVHGFNDAADYYEQCSSKNFINSIRTPTLVLNAINDPILSKQSFDHTLFRNLETVHLETTKYGGHVGFTQHHPQGYFWSEERALRFCEEN